MSNEPWGDIWYCKHHYANELSKLGYQTYFINAPNHWELKHLFIPEIKTTKINPNLTIIDYHNPFPLRVLPKLFRKVNDFILRSRIKNVIENVDNLVVWSFDPLRFTYFPLSNNIIYHIADPYMSIKSTKEMDPILAKKAKLILCTRSEHVAHYESLACENVIFQPHAISRDEFILSENKVEGYKKRYGDYTLFIGTLSDDIEFDLMQKILDCVKINLVVIGQDHKVKSIMNRIVPNERFHFLGTKKGQDLKEYISASKVCITCYKFDLNNSNIKGSPLKILNYLSQHKVVITSRDSGIKALDNKAIYLAKNKEEFIELLKKGIGNELVFDENAVKQYLDDKTYPKMIDNALSRLDLD